MTVGRFSPRKSIYIGDFKPLVRNQGMVNRIGHPDGFKQFSANGLIKFITELQNFNLVQSRDRTDCQSIEQLANHQDTMSEPVVDS